MKPSTYWWNVQTDPHEMVFDTVEQLTENQKYRKRDNFNHARLYGNAFLSDLQSPWQPTSHPVAPGACSKRQSS